MASDVQPRRYAGPMVLAGIAALLVGSGLSLLDTRWKASDYRPFASIVEQCKAKGFVQNAHVRVLCDVERPMQPRAADIPVDHPPARKKR